MAHAQVSEIQQTLFDISMKVNQITDEQMLLQVHEQLKMIENMIDGSQLPNPNENAPQLSCKSRDNDNLAPYIFVEKLQNGETQNLNFKFKSKEICESSIAKTRSVAVHGLYCVSRDGDDLNPIHLVLISTNELISSQTLMTNYKFKTFENCFKTLSFAQLNLAKKFNFCVSRDGDDIRPFKIISMNVNGQFFEEADQYSTFEECQASL
jgi:hypothetical protein